MRDFWRSHRFLIKWRALFYVFSSGYVGGIWQKWNESSAFHCYDNFWGDKILKFSCRIFERFSHEQHPMNWFANIICVKKLVERITYDDKIEQITDLLSLCVAWEFPCFWFHLCALSALSICLFYIFSLSRLLIIHIIQAKFMQIVRARLNSSHSWDEKFPIRKTLRACRNALRT